MPPPTHTLQALYLRLKSFQRFTESWAIFERAGALGTFDKWLQPTAEGAERPLLRVASLGGGPGYELLALAWYLRELAAARGVRPPRLDLVSRGLQPRAPSLQPRAPSPAPQPQASSLARPACIQPSSRLRPRAPSLSASCTPAPPAPPRLQVSLDLQPSWEPYLHALPEPDGVEPEAIYGAAKGGGGAAKAKGGGDDEDEEDGDLPPVASLFGLGARKASWADAMDEEEEEAEAAAAAAKVGGSGQGPHPNPGPNPKPKPQSKPEAQPEPQPEPRALTRAPTPSRAPTRAPTHP